MQNNLDAAYDTLREVVVALYELFKQNKNAGKLPDFVSSGYGVKNFNMQDSDDLFRFILSPVFSECVDYLSDLDANRKINLKGFELVFCAKLIFNGEMECVETFIKYANYSSFKDELGSFMGELDNL